MNDLAARIGVENLGQLTLVVFAAILLVILIISFRSRAVVFCQYLEAMTGVKLSPADVRRVYRSQGKSGVREMFLDLIIREDLRQGPISIPGEEEPPDSEAIRLDEEPRSSGAETVI